jgi:hypothetical protein
VIHLGGNYRMQTRTWRGMEEIEAFTDVQHKGWCMYRSASI